MSVQIGKHPYQFWKLVHVKVVHLPTDKELVQGKPYDTILDFRTLLGATVCLFVGPRGPVGSALTLPAHIHMMHNFKTQSTF